MIIINLKGGLGNQMFQYATGLFMSTQNSEEIKIDMTGYLDSRILKSDTPRTFDLINFNISKPIATKEEISKLKYPMGIFSKGYRFFRSKILKKHFLDYHPEILKKKKYYLDGYWQSEKNFIGAREIILQEFTLKNESENFKEIVKNISDNSLSIHVRHGDYMNDSKTNKHHGVLSIEYYKNAYNLIKQKTNIDQVVIFTDDPNWAKENFSFINETIIYASDFNLTAPEELILMSKCAHNIIANSSFSWWGAWLNQNSDKIVIAPKIWFRKGEYRHKNIVPTSWIRI